MGNMLDFITDQILDTYDEGFDYRKATVKCNSVTYDRIIREIEEKNKLTWVRSDKYNIDLDSDYKFVAVNGIEISLVIDDKLEFPVLIITLKRLYE